MSRDPVAGRIAAALELRGKSQKWLAAQLGTNPATVQGWATQGKPPGATHLARIPEILAVNGHWLLTGKGQIEPPADQPDVESARLEGRLEGLRLMQRAFEAMGAGIASGAHAQGEISPSGGATTLPAAATVTPAQHDREVAAEQAALAEAAKRKRRRKRA